jgi:outer membrane protein TolC
MSAYGKWLSGPLFAVTVALGRVAAAAEPAPAAAPALAAWDLPTVIRQAVERNPGLQAARSRWQAAVELYPQALSLPDPMLEYRYSAMSNATQLGLSQRLPPPPMILAESRMALAEAQMARLKVDIALRDLIVEVKLSYHELAYLERALTITQQNHDLLTHIEQVAAARYAQSQATLNDLLKAQAQSGQLDYDLVLLRELQDTERVRLLSLLDLPSSTAVGPVVALALEPLELTPEEVEQRALASRQELELMLVEVRKAGLSVDLATSAWWPELNVMLLTVADAGMEERPEAKDAWMAEVSVSLPLDVRKKRAAVREARATQAAAAGDLRAMAAETRALVRKAYFAAHNARRLLDLYERTLIPQAKQAMQTAEAWNVDQEKNLPGLLETQSTWLNFNLARLRALTDYQQSLARLERLAGGRLTAAAAPQEAP